MKLTETPEWQELSIALERAECASKISTQDLVKALRLVELRMRDVLKLDSTPLGTYLRRVPDAH